MSKNLFVFVSGSSGVGKNTVINTLMSKDENIEFLRSHTSRPKRIDDKENVYYYVPSNAEFEKLIEQGDILEFDKFNNHYYGISISELKNQSKKEKTIIKDLTVLGVSNVKTLMKDKLNMVSVFLTADKKVLKERLIKRQTDKKQIKNRLKVYKHEQKQMAKYDFVIYNNDLNKTINRMNGIINISKNNLPILAMESCQKVNGKKVDKLALKASKGKSLKPIKVIEYEDLIYIVEGVNEYLAELKSKTHSNFVFVDTNKTLKPDENNIKEWKKLIDLYK